jgi:hypothetical protein
MSSFAASVQSTQSESTQNVVTLLSEGEIIADNSKEMRERLKEALENVCDPKNLELRISDCKFHWTHNRVLQHDTSFTIRIPISGAYIYIHDREFLKHFMNGNYTRDEDIKQILRFKLFNIYPDFFELAELVNRKIEELIDASYGRDLSEYPGAYFMTIRCHETLVEDFMKTSELCGKIGIACTPKPGEYHKSYQCHKCLRTICLICKRVYISECEDIPEPK